MATHVRDAAADRRLRVLRVAALVYGTGLLLHGLDHLRRGVDELTRHVFWAGNVSTVAGIVTVVLVLTRHRWGPTAAAAVGLPTALGVAAVHLPPEWGALSDSLVDGGADGWTYVAVAIEIGGAAALGLAGLAVLRAAGWASRAPEPTTAT
jgi:hypothetical protein